MIIIKVLLAAVAAAGLAVAAGHPGKAPYDKACKSCHGADGAPNAAIARVMKVEMRHLGDKAVLAKSDTELNNDIVKGVGKMKPVTKLSANEVDNVVAYMRTFEKK